MNNVKYEHSPVMFLDYVKPAYFNRDWFEAFEYVCGDCGPLDFYFRMQKGSLETAFEKI